FVPRRLEVEVMAVRGEHGDAPAGHPSVELTVADEAKSLRDGEAASILHPGMQDDAARSEDIASPLEHGLRRLSDVALSCGRGSKPVVDLVVGAGRLDEADDTDGHPVLGDRERGRSRLPFG